MGTIFVGSEAIARGELTRGRLRAAYRPIFPDMYDGIQHQTDRKRYAWDAKRLRMVQRRGWLHIRVIKEDRPHDVLNRVRAAWAQRETEARVAEPAA